MTNNLSFSMVFKILQAFYVTNYVFIVNTTIYKRKWAPHHGTLSIFMLKCALHSESSKWIICECYCLVKAYFSWNQIINKQQCFFSQAPMQTLFSSQRSERAAAPLRAGSMPTKLISIAFPVLPAAITVISIGCNWFSESVFKKTSHFSVLKTLWNQNQRCLIHICLLWGHTVWNNNNNK